MNEELSAATDSVDQYGVVGHPITHSHSPFIHGLFAKQTGQAMVYRRHDVPAEQFREWIRGFFGNGGRGLNVTIPHKVVAADIADELTPRALRAGAVNTLAVQKDRRILGDNTDGVGLIRDLTENLGLTITRRRILIIGAGGATRGIIAPLLAFEPVELVVANRTADRAQALVAQFEDLGAIRGCGISDLSVGTFDIVINATSASLTGDMPNIPSEIISATTACYDLAYCKTETPFTRWALDRGCESATQGWGMLVEQAAEAFCLWRGIRPETAPVLAALAGHALSAS
jgi:shikimate dehydrogenase